MTDKEQIIIDGVNVKDCRRRIGKDNYCRYFKRLCSDNNFNCVWKQLARKTQECEELKKERMTLTNKNTLLEEIENYKINIKTLRFGVDTLASERDRYCKALEEIEKIVNEPCVADTQEDCKHCDIWCEHKDILDIINKAKGEE